MTEHEHDWEYEDGQQPYWYCPECGDITDADEDVQPQIPVWITIIRTPGEFSIGLGAWFWLQLGRAHNSLKIRDRVLFAWHPAPWSPWSVTLGRASVATVHEHIANTQLDLASLHTAVEALNRKVKKTK